MSSVILDVTTLGLDQTIRNLEALPSVITDGVARQIEKWYNTRYKKTVLRIIKTGEGMARNRGMYAALKGTTQPLMGRTGVMYAKVSAAQPLLKKTRGREIRFSIVYADPFYLALVHDGFTAKGFATGHPNAVVPPRPFVEVARDKELPVLFEMIGDLFDGLDLTSSVLGPQLVPSTRS